MSKTYCSRCVFDDEIPEISFDDNGACNYCHQFDAREKWTEKYKSVIGQLDDVNHLLFETIKNSGAV